MPTKERLTSNLKLTERIVSQLILDLQSSEQGKLASAIDRFALFKRYQNSEKSIISLHKAIDSLLTEIEQADSIHNDLFMLRVITLNRLALIHFYIRQTIALASPEQYRAIYATQVKIARLLQKDFNQDFQLPKQLYLGDISALYQAAYVKEYGQGLLGFFALPIKRFLQQSTRQEELRFLKEVDDYCANTPTIGENDKNFLRLGAAKLVYDKISTETFGKGSLLSKLLKVEIEAFQVDHFSKQMANDFLQQCDELKLSIPKHLKAFNQSTALR